MFQLLVEIAYAFVSYGHKKKTVYTTFEFSLWLPLHKFPPPTSPLCKEFVFLVNIDTTQCSDKVMEILRGGNKETLQADEELSWGWGTKTETIEGRGRILS